MSANNIPKNCVLCKCAVVFVIVSSHLVSFYFSDGYLDRFGWLGSFGQLVVANYFFDRCSGRDGWLTGFAGEKATKKDKVINDLFAAVFFLGSLQILNR
jgi:hypothetical protein